MIRYTQVERVNQARIFKEQRLAHQWCKGEGLELGAGAHNPFNLPGSLNVAPGDDPVFRQAEIEICGMYAEIDIVAEGHDIPVGDGTQDYIISSHVVEHFPDPLRAFIEWNRILKPGGIVFMIVPQRNADPHDAKQPVSKIAEIVEAYEQGYTVDDSPLPVVRRGHYFVYTLDTMLNLIRWANDNLHLGWEVVAHERRDTKVGNGFTVVCRKMG
ncbi:MAG TPA: methyltransferase domain-containing protein [Anaerolineales bacterium]|nr:methyltransferase domain-containing protein [Anaerolineales bacterium]